MDNKIKVLAYCDAPTCATGFGTVSRNIFEALTLTGRYEIDVLGINYWGDPHQYPYRIWPVGTNQERDPYGRKKVCGMIPQMQYDLLFFLQDTFILDFIPELIPYLKTNGSKQFRSICYFPIDGTPKEQWIKNVNPVDYLVAYSEFGKEQAKNVYPQVQNMRNIPHGVNLSDYRLLPEEEVKVFRKRYFAAHADKFIFTNLNRNQQRKDIPRTIEAFRAFKKQVPESILYLHMARQDQGWDLPEVCKAYGLDITSDVIFPENFGPNQGYPREVVNMIYNASDCVISTTLGEGWGLSLSKDSKVLCESGIKCIEDVMPSDNVVLSGEVLKVNGGATYKLKKDKKVFKLITYGNRVLVGSEDHHIPVVNKGDVKLGDIEPGDRVYVDKMKFKGEVSEQIDILDYINPDGVEYDSHFVWKKMGFSSKSEYSISTVMEATEETKKVVETAIKVYLDGEETKSDRVALVVQYLESIGYTRPLVKVNRFIPIGGMLFKLLGYYVAEGDHENGNGANFSFHAKEIDYHREVSLALKYLFGVSTLVKIRENKAEVRTRSSIVSEFLSSLCGIHAANKKVPNIVFNSTSELIREFLLGYFNGDGCYKSTTEISCTTVSEMLHYQILYLLSGYGIFARRNKRKELSSYDIYVSGLDRVKLANLFNVRYMVSSNVYRQKDIEDLGNCWSVPVISNDVIENDGMLFSDIAVEDKHYFVANTIIVHNSWIEAMATKTPVIMPANTALIENITDDKGWLTKCGTNPSLFTVIPHDNEIIRPLVDVDDMVRCMLEIYNNPEEAKRRAENAYNWVTTDLEWVQAVGSQWVALFDEAYNDLIKSSKDGIVNTVDDGKTITTESF